MSCNCFINKKVNKNIAYINRLHLAKCSCNSRFTISERKSSFHIQPHDLSKIDKIKVDGCLIVDTNVDKCDYLFLYKYNKLNISSVIFVELKGNDVKHAICQLESSIDRYSNNINPLNLDVRACVVCTSYPNNNGTLNREIMRIKRKYNKKFRSFELYKSSRNMNYDCETDIYKQK